MKTDFFVYNLPKTRPKLLLHLLLAHAITTETKAVILQHQNED